MLSLKNERQRKPFQRLVPVRAEFVRVFVYFLIRDFESYGLVRIASKEQILVLFVGRLDALLVGRHEAVSRLNALVGLRVIDLEEQNSLLSVHIPALRHFVSWPSNFNRVSLLDVSLLLLLLLLLRGHRDVALLLHRPSRQVRLVPFALRVGQVVPFGIVQRETQFALESPDVIPHEVRVSIQVYGFQRKLPQPLSTIDRRLLR